MLASNLDYHLTSFYLSTLKPAYQLTRFKPIEQTSHWDSSVIDSNSTRTDDYCFQWIQQWQSWVRWWIITRNQEDQIEHQTDDRWQNSCQKWQSMRDIAQEWFQSIQAHLVYIEYNTLNIYVYSLCPRCFVGVYLLQSRTFHSRGSKRIIK